MAFELAAYGFFTAIFHKLLPRKKPFVYLSLIVAMIVGRLVWGGATFLLLSVNGTAFPFSAFLAGAVTNAIPGIILQIVLVPILVMILDNPKFFITRD